ncbi:MAG: lipoate--protein ligase family protein [Candidatus Aenigmatarchaeota archaeon]
MKKEWRLILEENCNGYYNMAVDEAIFINFPIHKIPTLRIYNWEKSFISIGYHQNINQLFKIDNSIPFVRRITGGGAILHQEELTYSLIFSKEDLDLSNKVKDSFKIICSFLIKFYSNLGLEAKFARDIFYEELDTHCDFCFATFQSFDLTINGKKIGGNAQRRSKNLILQEGSIPIKVNLNKIEKVFKNPGNLSNFTYLKELLKKEDTNFSKLSLLLAKSFRETFNCNLERGPLTIREKNTVEVLLKKKYISKKWNYYALSE